MEQDTIENNVKYFNRVIGEQGEKNKFLLLDNQFSIRHFRRNLSNLGHN